LYGGKIGLKPFRPLWKTVS